MSSPKSQRQLQVSEQIKRIIADIFMREGMSIMAGSFITILEADVSPDIKNVKIYLDIFGDNKNNVRILEKLNGLAPHFRHQLGGQMSSRNTPEIHFILDETQKKAIELESLLEKEAKVIAKEIKKPATKKPAKKTTKKK